MNIVVEFKSNNVTDMTYPHSLQLTFHMVVKEIESMMENAEEYIEMLGIKGKVSWSIWAERIVMVHDATIEQLQCMKETWGLEE